MVTKSYTIRGDRGVEIPPPLDGNRVALFLVCAIFVFGAMDITVNVTQNSLKMTFQVIHN